MKTKPHEISHSELTGGKKEGSDFDYIGKVSSESVFRHTGKSWKQWMGILEKAGARSLNHQEIVALLRTKYRLTSWWQQSVAMGFEIATGRRLPGQDAKGKYMVTATKALPCDVATVWKRMMSEEGLRVWLKPLAEVEIKPKAQFETSDGFFGEVRTVARNRRARLSWQDPSWERHTALEFMLVARPKKRSILVFTHTGIADIKTKDLLGKRWRAAAEAILGIFDKS